MPELYFSEEDVDRLLPMSEAIAAVEQAELALATAAGVNLPRRRLSVPQGAVLHDMCAALQRPERWYLGYKMYSTSRCGARFTVGLFDGQTGEPLARFAADRLGQRRTGAASGVATRLLASPEASELGIIGAGWQAESQVEAICHVRPIQKVRVYSRDPARRASFAAKMQTRLDVEVLPVDSAAAAVEGAAIVVTATNSKTPVLPDQALAERVHINAMGSNAVHRRELESATVRRADRIVLDSLQQCLQEAGDLVAALGDAPHGWSCVEELGTALAGKRGYNPESRLTIFKSTGLAIWDVACAAVIYENNRE